MPAASSLCIFLPFNEVSLCFCVPKPDTYILSNCVFLLNTLIQNDIVGVFSISRAKSVQTTQLLHSFIQQKAEFTLVLTLALATLRNKLEWTLGSKQKYYLLSVQLAKKKSCEEEVAERRNVPCQIDSPFWLRKEGWQWIQCVPLQW